MTMFLLGALVGALVTFAVAYLLGYRVGKRIIPSREDIHEYLDAQLAVEELDAAERRMRVQMHMAGRDTAPNPRAGQPVRISDIQITRE